MRNKFRNARKEAALEALDKSMGNVSIACREAGISRQTFYDWLNKDKKFFQEAWEIDERNLDISESNVYKATRNPASKDHMTACIFHLKCKGKKRGWVEKYEMEDVTPQETEVKIDLSILSDEELEMMHKIQAKLNKNAG